MDTETKHELICLLRDCPVMKDADARQSLLEGLPRELQGQIKEHSRSDIHLNNIVTACLNYENGLQLLVEQIVFFDAGANTTNALGRFYARITRNQTPVRPNQKSKILLQHGADPARIEEAVPSTGVDQRKQRVGAQHNAGGDINTQAQGDVVAGNVTHMNGISPKEFRVLSKELGVTQIALENFFGILGKGAVPLKDLDSELRQVAERYKEFLSADWEQVMAQSKLSAKIKAKDEFTHHSKQSRELIKKAQHKLKYLPSHPKYLKEYLKVMLMGGTVLSSAGKLKEAEELLLKALDISNTEENRGLIRFNLFQINIRCRDYRKALENLQEAIKVDPGRYALHDVKKYPIESLLGAGGMGVVFLCFYPLKKKRVAVKCLWEKRENADEEAAIMQKVAGKYVPEIIDYDYSGSERAYFVSEYVEGAIDGAAWLKKHGKLSLEEGLEVGAQIAEALLLAHEKNIVHLDLKPANILLKRVEGRIEVKVIDFGLSKVANSLQEEAITRQQTRLGLSVFGQGIMGTLEYAPPEQLGYGAEYGEPDAKSDVFSFGTTLYHLLTGQSPRIPDPRKLPDLRELQYLILDCVELVPEKRLAIREVTLRLGRLAESIRKKKTRKADKKRKNRKPGNKPEPMKPPVEKAGAAFRDILQDGSQGPKMVQIPAGRFRMGDIQGSGYDNEKPVHEVPLDSFAIGVYPVTFEEYDKFAEVTGSEKPSDEGWGRGKRPVINVSQQEDAAKYCAWLSEQTEEEYRLLTEAEWEYACRAGSETDYCFGNDEKQLGEYAWYWENARGGTHPVGKKKPNVWGLYDMHGNVWEWVRDWMGASPEETVNNSVGPDSGALRACRGGSWGDGVRSVRAASRLEYAPDLRIEDLGFRCARVQKSQTDVAEHAGQVLRGPVGKKSAWADKLDRDKYGVFADFSIRGVIQRMRWIKPGRFMMGSPESEAQRNKDERLHEVILSRGFWLADTVCTQALWQAIMGKNPSCFQGEEKPVENVSWEDVTAFILQLNEEKPGLELCLPAETEWEYACRAGTDTPFWFGNNISPKQVNYNGNYPYVGGKKGVFRDETVEVKTLPCNAWGLYQMHGNVREWCADWYGSYPDKPVTDPIDPDSGSGRVMRGGSWADGGQNLRSAYRFRHLPGDRPMSLGFRFARGQ
ncbi:MAG: SUMF1/EgtB/PvdO family nonheme iron enzyme [Gammaproteobacteria bacterium]|nr:SUMF1/EgtB/PvdO family nonheme iron enzyme [Gammaproteobacteria bacterium]